MIADEGANDLVNGELDGGGVLGDRKSEALAAGHLVALMQEVMKVTEFLVVHSRLAALLAVELDVHASRCAEVGCFDFRSDSQHRSPRVYW